MTRFLSSRPLLRRVIHSQRSAIGLVGTLQHYRLVQSSASSKPPSSPKKGQKTPKSKTSSSKNTDKKTITTEPPNSTVLRSAESDPAFTTPGSNIFITKPFTMEHLNAKIDSEILAKPVTSKLPHQLCGDALEACELMITKFGDKTDQAAKAKISSLHDLLKLAPPASASELITAVFSHPAVPVDNELLRRYFLLRPDTDRAIGAMRAFYQHPSNSKNGAVIEKETFMIPFRKTLREEDADGAFKILDLTAASPQWLSNVKRQWSKAAAWWAGGFLATIQLSDLFVTSDLIAVGGLEGGFVVKTLVGVYLVNSTLLGLVACASRPGDNGGRVSWRNGVFQNQWYLRAQESRMLSQIVDMDQLRIENDGEVSARVLYELDARQRRLSDNADDIMLKEYWAKQGQGFEWVEPDIDPAEEEKIARDNVKRKTKGISDGHHERMQEQYIEGEQDDGWIQRVLQKDM